MVHSPTMALAPSVEVLPFLADPNPQVRQMAMASVVGFSAQNSPHRALLTDKVTDANGAPLKMWDDSPLDVLHQIKELCKDQPVGRVC